MQVLYEIVFIFIIYSFIGWVLESLYKSILQKRIVNSGFLGGPFCPIYGCGALIMYFALESLKSNIVFLFLAGFIILSIWEYIVGFFLELVFKTKYWDYSDKFCNINGRVCLLNSFFWGVLGILFILVIHPFIVDMVSFIPRTYVIVFLVVSSTYILADTIVTATNIIKVNINLEKLEKMENEIRRRIIVMKKLNKRKEIILKNKIETGIETIAKNIEEQRNRIESERAELISLIERKTKRIRKAFPTMKSDKLIKIFIKNDDIK